MTSYYRNPPETMPTKDDLVDPGQYDLKVEYPAPTPETMHPIAIITDPSFNSSRGIRHVISTVYGLIDSQIAPRCEVKQPLLYGYSARNDWIIEKYIQQYRIPANKVCHFTYLNDKVLSTKNGTATYMRRYIVRQYLSLVAFEPTEVYLFRDNSRSPFTQPLVERFKSMQIPMFQITSTDEREMIDFTTRILYKGDSAFIKINK